MQRRALLLASSALGAPAPFAAVAQRAAKLPVVGYVFGTVRTADMQDAEPAHAHPRAFVHRLRELRLEAIQAARTIPIVFVG